MLAYSLLGAFVFLALEGATPADSAVAASAPDLGPSDLRSHTVERLWAITEDLNILYKENWTKLAAKELMDFQRVLMKSMRGAASEQRSGAPRDPPYRWSFAGSFLYALTLITTIGHGNAVPRSSAGKLASVAYACVGIPLVMLYLSTVGAALARWARALYARLRPPAPPPRAPPRPTPRTPFQAALNVEALGARRACREQARVPAPLSALVALAYVALGALVFRATERWSYLDGCYFAFASLATIGFGELRPGLYASTVSPRAEELALAVCCLYILVGVAVVATCFNLIQEELGGAVRALRAPGAERAVHSADAPADKLALAVLS